MSQPPKDDSPRDIFPGSWIYGAYHEGKLIWTLAHQERWFPSFLSCITINLSTYAMSQDPRPSTGRSFQHPVIDARCQVRLLRLYPSPAKTGIIQATFHVVAIEQLLQTAYRALSYTWGSGLGENDPKYIQVNGQSIQVRENLYDFLCSTIRRGEYGLFFIDAICINQLDQIEKPKQVMQMDKIYRYAVQVIAWLGALNSEQYYNVKVLHRSICQKRSTWEQAAWDGLNFVSHVNYWSRMWVVQEVVLATSIQVWCGPFTFPLELFEASSSRMAVTKLGFTPSGSPNIFLSTCARVQSPAQIIATHRLRHVIRPIRRAQWDEIHMMTEEEARETLMRPKDAVHEYKSGLPDPLWHAMRKFGRQECSNPMDKLYGLLGILHEDTREQVRPDYGRGLSFAFYQTLRVGLEELCPNGEPVFSDRFQNPDNSYISYYCDARNSFSIDDKMAMPILRQVCKELDFYRRGRNALLDVQLNAIFGWGSLDIQHHRAFEKTILEIGEDEVPPTDSPLFRFHSWQTRKLETLLKRLKRKPIESKGWEPP